ncbi:hypothetical protein ACI77O_12740 [Pseudomonas tritici]|uniref:hypothetical protein n=1 Tax=Pseudomonas tritici TaxID=2745518 RepID=UPI00387B811F
MDQIEFSRRLRVLADGVATEAPSRPTLDATAIVGRLAFVAIVRRVQVIVLVLVMATLSALSIKAIGTTSHAGLWALALGHALICLLAIRWFPYRNPAMALKEGLQALSLFQLNDPGLFISGLRTDLSRVNNKLLRDLCMQLTLDRRRTPPAC